MQGDLPAGCLLGRLDTRPSIGAGRERIASSRATHDSNDTLLASGRVKIRWHGLGGGGNKQRDGVLAIDRDRAAAGAVDRDNAVRRRSRHDDRYRVRRSGPALDLAKQACAVVRPLTASHRPLAGISAPTAEGRRPDESGHDLRFERREHPFPPLCVRLVTVACTPAPPRRTPATIAMASYAVVADQTTRRSQQ